MKRDQISVRVNNLDTNQAAGVFKQVNREYYHRPRPYPHTAKHVTVRLSKQNRKQVFEGRTKTPAYHNQSINSMIELISEDESSEEGRTSIDSPEPSKHRKASSVYSGAAHKAPWVKKQKTKRGSLDDPQSEEDECQFLTKSPLRRPYKYKENPVSSLRRSAEGEPLRRSIVGSEKGFKEAEGALFLKKIKEIKKKATFVDKKSSVSLSPIIGMTKR